VFEIVWKCLSLSLLLILHLLTGFMLSKTARIAKASVTARLANTQSLLELWWKLDGLKC